MGPAVRGPSLCESRCGAASFVLGFMGSGVFPSAVVFWVRLGVFLVGFFVFVLVF